MIKCTTCGRTKPEENYIKLRGEGLSDRCLACRQRSTRGTRAWKERQPEGYEKQYLRKYLYGITSEQYTQLLEEQNGKCAICERDMVKPCIDHCHSTKKVRGLLCYTCNTALGKFSDDPNLLQKAINYLKINVESP